MDVYVTEEGHGRLTWYQVWVDGKVYDTFNLLRGPRLTLAQMREVAQNYREALEQ